MKSMHQLEGTPPGKVLTVLRQGVGFNQRSMALAFGVDQGMVSRYENDTQPLPRSAYLRAADVLALKRGEEEPEPDEDGPLWLLVLADPQGSAGFAQVTDTNGRVAVLGGGELACATAAALTALGGLHAFALPVWRSWILGEQDGPDLEALDADPDDLATRLRAAEFVTSSLRDRIEQVAPQALSLEVAT
jgi:transcriptional regulator with XRE-family HTH domain